MHLPHELREYRRFALDGALLLFDRNTGWNVLLDGEETSHLRQLAPRAIQFGITNRCNLACEFCSRDVTAASTWTIDSAFNVLSDLAVAGVLEVAFGGGEPFAFKGFADLLARLWDETPLAVSVTTNGVLLRRDVLRGLRGRFGQIRVSLYDDNDWRDTVAMLAEEEARFGVNLLVTPARLDSLERWILELAALGCWDILLLSYNGADRALHLSPTETDQLSRRVAMLSHALRGRVSLKLDVCWGERLEAVPQVLRNDDCGAGRDFVVVTSDQRVSPCSFHHISYPASTAAEILDVWRDHRRELAAPAHDAGCARRADFGLSQLTPLRVRS